jgi:hypothetical protein
MRIQQFLCITGICFERGFIEKYGFIPYTNINGPLFISGFGKNICKNIVKINKHKGFVVLCWAGGDLIWFLQHTAQRNKLLQTSNLYHIAISRCLEKDLQTIGVPYKFLPITPFKNDDIKPEPLGDSIYIYKPDLTPYNPVLVQKIKQSLPELNFIEIKGQENFARFEVLGLYKKCFLGLRFTNHDGVANTVCEMGLMGRRVIHNGDLPNSISYDPNNVGDIVAKIRAEYNNISLINHNELYKDVAQDVFNYLNIGEDWLNTEYYD